MSEEKKEKPPFGGAPIKDKFSKDMLSKPLQGRNYIGRGLPQGGGTIVRFPRRKKPTKEETK